MQSSGRSVTPRLVDVGRRDSNTSIQIDQEVTVVSSRRDGFKDTNQRATYSTMPSSSNGPVRQSSRGTTSTVTGPRWNSETNISRASSINRPRGNLHNQSSIDVEMLDSNRESMKALSDFLRTKEPPPDHFMSLPDSDTMSLRSLKKSTFKIFGRQKSKKAKQSRLIQLPDSAVSAKTYGGTRHIAISIPVEYDHLEKAPTQYQSQTRPHSQPNKLPSDRAGTVTVLKPVRELRESASSYSPPFNHHRKPSSQHSTTSAATPAAELLGPETVRTLENYYTQLNHQQKEKGNVEGVTELKPEVASRPQRSYIVVSPLTMNPRDSQISDLRHSGGTAYSTVSIATQGHSRGVSSVSTAPSINQAKVDIQPRSSSISKVPRSLQAELEHAYAAVDSVPRDPSASTSSDKAENIISGTSKSQSPQAAFRTAEIAKGYNAVGVEHIRRHTPKPPSPAPTRRLPDVPESPLVPSFMPRPSPPPSEGKMTPPAATNTSKSKVAVAKISPDDPVLASQQSRQDRVKARKARDMAALRERSSNPQTLSDISRDPSQRTLVIAPQNPKRRSISEERLRRRKENTLSAILVVADLTPIAGDAFLSDLVAKASSSSNSNANLSATGTHTPPRSFTSSHPSDSDTVTKEDERSRSLGPSSPRSVLDSRRQERRAKRNMSLKEKELEIRLQKIEKDNTMLLNTLSGIAKSFGDLNKVLPRNRPRREGLLLRGDSEDLETGGLSPFPVRKMRSLEPVMRELQDAAGRVSHERLGEFESDDVR